MTEQHLRIQEALQNHGLTVEDAGLARVVRWAEEAARHGQKTNLIGTSDAMRIAHELVADSLQVLRLVTQPPSRVVDVGAGAGVPGLILAGATGWPATLIEPRAKRTMFLKHAARAMGLSDRIHAYECRLDATPAEALAGNGKLWVSRAVFAPEEWLAVAAASSLPGDQIALWCNGHVEATSLAYDATLLQLDAAYKYSVRGPGSRTIFLFSRSAAKES